MQLNVYIHLYICTHEHANVYVHLKSQREQNKILFLISGVKEQGKITSEPCAKCVLEITAGLTTNSAGSV